MKIKSTSACARRLACEASPSKLARSVDANMVAGAMGAFQQLAPGIFLFPNALTDDDKRVLRPYINESHIVMDQQFYVPKFKGKYPMSLRMYCMGKHWSAEDNKYHNTRVDYDNKHVYGFPNKLNEIAAKFSKQVFPYHNPEWDICIVNEYTEKSKLGLHQDNSESEEALDIGHPVISFSLGASCIFEIDPVKYDTKKINLNDGDVLIFGGPARMLYHGVEKMLGDKRYNLTLRKF